MWPVSSCSADVFRERKKRLPAAPTLGNAKPVLRRQPPRRVPRPLTPSAAPQALPDQHHSGITFTHVAVLRLLIHRPAVLRDSANRMRLLLSDTRRRRRRGRGCPPTSHAGSPCTGRAGHSAAKPRSRTGGS